ARASPAVEMAPLHLGADFGLLAVLVTSRAADAVSVAAISPLLAILALGAIRIASDRTKEILPCAITDFQAVLGSQAIRVRTRPADLELLFKGTSPVHLAHSHAVRRTLMFAARRLADMHFG